MTKSFCLHSLLKCVEIFRNWTDERSTSDNPYAFYPGSIEHIKVLDSYYKENKLDDLNFKTIISENSEEIMSFFKDNGFNISINSLGENQIGVGALFDLFLKWKNSYYNSKSFITNSNILYSAFSATVGVNYYHSDLLNSYGASLKAENDHEVFFLPIQKERYHLVEKLKTLEFFDFINVVDSNLLKKNDSFFDSVRIPYVKFTDNSNIDFMLGFTLAKTDWTYTVAEALQQNKVALNEEGLKVASASYLGLSGCSGCAPAKENHLIIDTHFLMWVKNPNFKLPYFVGFVDTDSWIQK